MTTRKTRISRRVRERIAETTGYRCGYCATSEFTVGYRLIVDLILPMARRGKPVLENLCLACAACNQFKGARVQARDPITGRRVRLFNPRRQEWKSHFRWNEDGTEIVGLTACGRTTVTALEMNRPEIVAARSFWVQVGWWPPKD